MGKGRKQTSKKAADKPSRNGATPKASKGKAVQLDEKLARAIAKRVKKLRRELSEATKLEARRVRALDKAHRRRQLIESALEELSGAPAPSASTPVAMSSAQPAIERAAEAQPEPAAVPAAAAQPTAGTRRSLRRRPSTQG